MIKAVVFDLDGTITKPFLNFQTIRLEIGGEADRLSLLDRIAAMTGPERERALEILERHERAAVENAELNHGVRELLDYLAGRGLPCAIVTRNSEASTRDVLARLEIRPDRVITRDSDLPVKPDPAPLLHLAREWGIAPGNLLMVGDHQYDLECGRAAGALTCLVTNRGEPGREWKSDYRVDYPGAVIGILETLGPGHEPSSGNDHDGTM